LEIDAAGGEKIFAGPGQSHGRCANVAAFDAKFRLRRDEVFVVNRGLVVAQHGEIETANLQAA
jgi:hypothetical protein